jgi:tetrahydromethanopterin S-methyltransferase subunit G
VANIPLLPSRGEFIERTNFKLRLYALKKYRFMTLNNRHIRNSSFTPSPAQTALKKIAKVIGIILATLIGLLMWAIVKPIFRGVGWVISIITTLMIIYWILTL